MEQEIPYIYDRKYLQVKSFNLITSGQQNFTTPVFYYTIVALFQ